MPAPSAPLEPFNSLWEGGTPGAHHSSQPGAAFWWSGAGSSACPVLLISVCICNQVCLNTWAAQHQMHHTAGISWLQTQEMEGLFHVFKCSCAHFQITIIKKKTTRKDALMPTIFNQNKFKALQSRQWHYSNIPRIHYIKHEILSLGNICSSFPCF